MGAIFFYIFIYFVGYYGSNILNMFTVRPLITNRFIAALVPVVGVAILHGYMIATKPPPASQNITVESALFSYVIMPVVIVTLGAIYFMWNTRRGEEEEAEEAARKAAEEVEEDGEPEQTSAEEEFEANAEKAELKNSSDEIADADKKRKEH
ncbi:hypothetical protein SAMN05216302_100818 [Nitrosomonas aestuarii]|uniref:Uncharacterized protein n=1 Tax=Nitrosomonas aestuarii TaxID=52441 RepID=A0A1I4A4X1_9PROT|nr:hypothetical protein [Nitrosomonas aestuarii]SFK50981.1 hypothetical protein SAMN05216302_100818 [Nitrosomonas aestuarii]